MSCVEETWKKILILSLLFTLQVWWVTKTDQIFKQRLSCFTKINRHQSMVNAEDEAKFATAHSLNI